MTGDIIIIALLCVAMFFAIRSLVKKHKSGSCCGDCAECCSGGSCSGNTKKDKSA